MVDRSTIATLDCQRATGSAPKSRYRRVAAVQVITGSHDGMDTLDNWTMGSGRGPDDAPVVP